MKAPLLIQIENGTHTVQTFANRAAYLDHLKTEEARAQASGLKMTGCAVRSSRKTNLYVTHPANEPAPMPSRKTLNAILKQYKEDAR